MNLIPWPYRWLALVLLAAALIGFGWIKGAGHVQAQWDAAAQQQTLQAAAIRERQAQATVKVVTQYVDRVRVVREKRRHHHQGGSRLCARSGRCCLHYQPWLCAPARRCRRR